MGAHIMGAHIIGISSAHQIHAHILSIGISRCGNPLATTVDGTTDE